MQILFGKKSNGTGENLRNSAPKKSRAWYNVLNHTFSAQRSSSEPVIGVVVEDVEGVKMTTDVEISQAPPSSPTATSTVMSLPDDEGGEYPSSAAGTLRNAGTVKKTWEELILTIRSAHRLSKAFKRRSTLGAVAIGPKSAVDLTQDQPWGRLFIYRNLAALLLPLATVDPESTTSLEGQVSQIRERAALANLVEASNIRSQLLQVSSKLNVPVPELSAALQKDDEEIHTVLSAVLSDKELKAAALKLRGSDAQNLLNLIQSMLDKGFATDQDDKTILRAAHSLIYKLSVACGIFPSSLMITGAVLDGKDAVSGGGYADIYLGRYKREQVALKRLRVFLKGNDRHEVHKMICREALLWKQVKHRYVLPFLGIDASIFSPSMCLISPWMMNGNINSYMRENGDNNLRQHLREIAEGMKHLHKLNIIHGDLRGANILIDTQWHAQIADFGLAIIAETTFSDDGSPHAGAVRWMAPELFSPPQNAEPPTFGRTKPTDVYAFACTCVELSTRRVPFPDVGYDITVSLRVIAGDRPPLQVPSKEPDGLPERRLSDDLENIVRSCWHQDPSCRPTMEGVLDELNALSP